MTSSSFGQRRVSAFAVQRRAVRRRYSVAKTAACAAAAAAAIVDGAYAMTAMFAQLSAGDIAACDRGGICRT
jgi:hypothetical protein